MFALGLILILLSAGVLVAVLASGTDDQAVMYGGGLHLPTLVVFLAGAAALLLFMMGLELVRSGLKRANRNRKNTKRLRKLEKREALQRETAATGETTGHPAGHPAGEPAGEPAVGPTDSPAAGPTGTAAPDEGTRPGGSPSQTPPAPR